MGIFKALLKTVAGLLYIVVLCGAPLWWGEVGAIITIALFCIPLFLAFLLEG